jgi:hypothetical protein
MTALRRNVTDTVDDRCEGCDRSVIARFPHDLPPAFCDACDDEFRRELAAGHVTDALSGQVVWPA